jgi:integrase
MRGHVRQRGKTWCVVYDEGHDENGRRRQRWRGGYATKREAEEALTKILGTLANGEYVPPERITLAEFVNERWLPVITGDRRPSTVSIYTSNMKLHVLPKLGGVKLQKLDASMLNRLYVDLLAARPDGSPGLGKRSVRLVAATLSSALEDARRWRLVARNVARDSDPPRPERRRTTTWSRRELAAFLEHVADDRLFALWRFLATTGCRRGEALGLTWRALSLDEETGRGRAAIEQALVSVDKQLVFSEPKTDSGRRSIELDAETVRVLVEHRERQQVERALFGTDYTEHDLVFPRADGRPLEPHAISARFVTLAKQVKLPPIRLHDLRHGAATMLLGLEVHPEIVRRRLGHSNIGITLGLYSHAVPELETSAAHDLGALVDGR